jgi:hypothetical protein
MTQLKFLWIQGSGKYNNPQPEKVKNKCALTRTAGYLLSLLTKAAPGGIFPRDAS